MIAGRASRRRAVREEGDHLDRWLVSYADFITLLFAFFTTLYAISHVDLGKLKMFTGSMRTAFRATAVPSQSGVIEGIVPSAPDVMGVEKQMRAAFGTREDVRIWRDTRGVVVSFEEGLLFRSGEAALLKEAGPSLYAAASVLKRLPYDILVEGHTDNVAMAQGDSGHYRSNWELSSVRAAAVLEYFVLNYGFAPERFSASGYAEFRPVDSNMTPEGRARNRRVDLVVLTGAAAETPVMKGASRER